MINAAGIPAMEDAARVDVTPFYPVAAVIAQEDECDISFEPIATFIS